MQIPDSNPKSTSNNPGIFSKLFGIFRRSPAKKNDNQTVHQIIKEVKKEDLLIEKLCQVETNTYIDCFRKNAFIHNCDSDYYNLRRCQVDFE